MVLRKEVPTFPTARHEYITGTLVCGRFLAGGVGTPPYPTCVMKEVQRQIRMREGKSYDNSKQTADSWRLMEDITGRPGFMQTRKYRKYEQNCSVVSGEFSATAIVHPMLLPEIKLRSEVPSPTDQTGP